MLSNDDLESDKIILEKTVQDNITRNNKTVGLLWKKLVGILKRRVTQSSSLSFLIY